ncbi:MAG: hypothetical protein IJ468_04540 [Lachnospiraceae bacterium]|nr:hypothetical protein [Lachnospiraceae bacterium]
MLRLIRYEMERICCQTRFVLLFLCLLLLEIGISFGQAREIQEPTILTQQEYEEYIDSLVTHSRNSTSIAIFADRNSFVYRNAKQSGEIYDGMRGTVISEEPADGIRLAVDTDETDVLVVVWIVMLCYWGMLEERRKGQYLLNRTMKKGRGFLGRAKLAALLLLSVGGILVLTTARVLVMEAAVGLGSMGRTLQSAFPSSIQKWSMGTFLLVWYLFRSAACVTLTAVCCGCTLWCRKTGWAAWIWLIVLLSGFCCYHGIDRQSWLVSLKYLNLWYFLGCADFFTEFHNLNCFGHPVNMIWVMGIGHGILLAVFLPLNLFGHGMVMEAGKRTGRVLRFGWIRHTSHLLHEGYKLLVMGGWLILLVLLAAAAGKIYEKKYPLYSTEQEYYQWQYCQRLQGTWDEEKDVWLQEEGERLEQIVAKMQEEALLMAAGSQNFEIYNAYQIIRSRADRLKELPNGQILYEKGYGRLIWQTNAGYYGLMAGIAVLFLLVSMGTVWGMEYRYGQKRLICATKAGWRQIRKKKRVWILTAGLMIFLFLFVPFYMRVIQTYGLNGLSASAASLSILDRVPGWISLGMYLLGQQIIQLAVIELAALGMAKGFTWLL